MVQRVTTVDNGLRFAVVHFIVAPVVADVVGTVVEIAAGTAVAFFAAFVVVDQGQRPVVVDGWVVGIILAAIPLASFHPIK